MLLTHTLDWRVENKSIFFQGFLGFDYGKEKCKTLSSIFSKIVILRKKNKIINYIIYTIFSNTKYALFKTMLYLVFYFYCCACL